MFVSIFFLLALYRSKISQLMGGFYAQFGFQIRLLFKRKNILARTWLGVLRVAGIVLIKEGTIAPKQSNEDWVVKIIFIYLSKSSILSRKGIVLKPFMPNLIYIITFSFYWLVDSRVNSRTQLTFSSTEFLLLFWLMSHGKSVVHFLLVLSIINVPGGVWSSSSVDCSFVSALLTLSSVWMSEVWQWFRCWSEWSASLLSICPFSPRADSLAFWSISHDSITSFLSPDIVL